MLIRLHHHLSIAWQAACFAFNRSYRRGETIDEILGYTDALTGIPNRKAFEADRNNVHVFETFILIDVDNLKQMNDSFGHLFGDSILRSCAHTLIKSTEKVGKAYRLGGDEFALIVPQCWVKTVHLTITDRIMKDARFTISMGIAPPCGADGLTDELFNAAETDLYRSKHRVADLYLKFLADNVDNKEKSVVPCEMYADDSCIRQPMAIATAA